MTSRERVLLALDHKPTDRAPANYHANPDVTERLLSTLRLRDEEELLRRLQVDLRRININYTLPDAGPDAEGYLRNMWGLRWNPDLPAHDPAHVLLPFDEHSSVEEVRAHEWPLAEAVDISGVRAQCELYAGEYATYGAPWSPFFHEVGWLVRQENLYMWMHTRPDLVDAIIDGFVTYEVAATRRFLEACDGLLDITYFGNDFGTQRCLFISPAHWERFFRQPLKRFYDVSHEYGCRVMQHSCGSVREIIPSLIEDGVDILDPVQVRAAGMSLAELIRDFGDRLTFHGGVDTQRTLPFGTPAEVRAEVRSYLDLTRDRGGYILTSSQNFIADIPDENILAMYDENLRG
jgi:uroporphyrinogen decarboxylase